VHGVDVGAALKASGVSRAELEAAIPAAVPLAGLDRTGKGDGLSFVRLWAAAVTAWYALTGRVVPPPVGLHLKMTRHLSARSLAVGGKGVMTANPLHVARAAAAAV
jgi:hypothetical protein